MSDQMREIKERRAAFFKGSDAPTRWCDCIHCSAITKAPEDIDYLIARLESAYALVKELEDKLERHRGWTGLSLSHDLEKAEARIAVLESALENIATRVMEIGPRGTRAADAASLAYHLAREALQGEASKGGNAFNTSTPVPAESTSESKALVEHAHNTSDLLAAVTALVVHLQAYVDVCDCPAGCRLCEEGYALLVEYSYLVPSLDPFLEPSPAEQKGEPAYTCPSCRYPRTASNCEVCAGEVKS